MDAPRDATGPQDPVAFEPALARRLSELTFGLSAQCPWMTVHLPEPESTASDVILALAPLTQPKGSALVRLRIVGIQRENVDEAGHLIQSLAGEVNDLYRSAADMAERDETFWWQQRQYLAACNAIVARIREVAAQAGLAVSIALEDITSSDRAD